MATRKIVLCVLLSFLTFFSLLYISCKNTDSDNSKHNEKPDVPAKTWYKRYTGTVNGRQAVVNLQCSGKATQGCYYYIDNGMIIDLITSGHNEGETGHLTLVEDNPAKKLQYDDNSGKDSWQLIPDTFGKNSSAIGKWISGDGNRSGNIDLTEDYTAGAYPLDVLVKGDTIVKRKGVVRVRAASLYDLVIPSSQMNKEEYDYLQAATLHFLGSEFLDVKNINDYIVQEDKKYFANFETLLADMKIDRETHEDWEYNFDHTRHLKVRYNNNGLLVLQLEESDHTGGGIMGSHFRNRYACIDVEQKKLWQLKDIMDMDAAKLSPLLNEEARIVFSIPKGTLAEKLRVNTMPLTDNIYITGTGITFCYYPGVIAPEEDGEISLFVPYTKLKNSLKQDFKKRMSI